MHCSGQKNKQTNQKNKQTKKNMNWCVFGCTSIIWDSMYKLRKERWWRKNGLWRSFDRNDNSSALNDYFGIIIQGYRSDKTLDCDRSYILDCSCTQTTKFEACCTSLSPMSRSPLVMAVDLEFVWGRLTQFPGFQQCHPQHHPTLHSVVL